MDFMDIEIEKELKIVYMGTPDFAVTVLKGLLSEYKIRAIVTQPDKIRGKDNEVSFSPVKKVGIDNSILVLQPERIKDEYEEILELKPDIIITCAYGQIIPKKILDCPRLGCINVHASLLPKLRGGAPIHKAILNGYKKTGITIMYMNQKMDEGDIISQRAIDILETDTASSLHDKLSILGSELLMETLPSIIAGTNERTKQDDTIATYASNIRREDERLNFKETKHQVYNQIRGLNSWPGAYCLYEGKILKVWTSYISDEYPQGFNGQITKIYKDGFGVKVSNGEVVITEVQLEGKKRMAAIDFVNGTGKDILGKVLS